MNLEKKFNLETFELFREIINKTKNKSTLFYFDNKWYKYYIKKFVYKA